MQDAGVCSVFFPWYVLRFRPPSLARSMYPLAAFSGLGLGLRAVSAAVDNLVAGSGRRAVDDVLSTAHVALMPQPR